MKGKETDVDIGSIEAWGQGPCFRWWDGVGFEVYGKHRAMKKIHCPAGRCHRYDFLVRLVGTDLFFRTF